MEQPAALPNLLAEDRDTWAVSVTPLRRRRLVRITMTHLKPALRAHLVQLGEAAGSVWVADWKVLDQPLAQL
jgi:hypothetical protein